MSDNLNVGGELTGLPEFTSASWRVKSGSLSVLAPICICSPKSCVLIPGPNICPRGALSPAPLHNLISSSWEGSSCFTLYPLTDFVYLDSIPPLYPLIIFHYHTLCPMIKIHIWKFKSRTITASHSLHSFCNAVV